MSKRYQVLARKYRPQAFRDVVGQAAVVTTLKNAIRFERVAHAYLFCGTRGVGKTTLARLFAKALNCQALTEEMEPCNACPSCKEILSGQSLDVIEIDGASNRGIDDIRQINETVGYAPSHGRYKIYIIDEVHMLTKEAFNALLKTLEEPPERAKFFFATTEPHKVLPTIISRCQRFDLARIKEEPITSKLDAIAKDLSRDVAPDALELIARFAEGSLRDAESLFDQILCFSDETITASIVRDTLGLVPAQFFDSLDEAFSQSYLPYAFECVQKLFEHGKDLSHFLEQLIEHYRNIVNAKCMKLPLAAAKHYTKSQALHILDLLIKAEHTFQKSAFQRVALESILLQIIRSKNRIPIEVLIRHLTENKEQIQALEAPLLEQEESVLEKPAPAPEPPAPVLEKPAPAPEPPAPVLEKPAPAPEPPAPVLEKPAPAPEPPAPVLEKPAPAPEPPAPVLEKPAPAPEPPTPGTRVRELILKPAPFNPFLHQTDQKTEPTKASYEAKNSNHPSHYDTIMRFAAIELEGTVKK